jgi:5-amino-6-(5-phospho-D-ribitylamino)uracil phosphatase
MSQPLSSPPRALLIDLDGTLLDGTDRIRPRNLAALHALRDSGTTVIVATGRSVPAALPAVEPLGLATPMLVFNGAAIWCPVRERLIEERILSNRAMEQALRFGRERGYLTMVQQATRRFVTPPKDEREALAVRLLHGLQVVPREELPDEYVIRISWLSGEHADSAQFAEEVAEAIDYPVYSTDFPLSVIAGHGSSPIVVVDVHAPCRGKAEGLRFLEEEYGIAPEEVIAIGDATNDIPMMRAAGLGVAVESGMQRAKDAADLVIGGNDSDAIAGLCEEFFTH